MTKQEIDRAKLAGVSARQANRPKDRNPFANKPALRHLADSWLAGWIEQDRVSTRGK